MQNNVSQSQSTMQYALLCMAEMAPDANMQESDDPSAISLYASEVVAMTLTHVTNGYATAITLFLQLRDLHLHYPTHQQMCTLVHPSR